MRDSGLTDSQYLKCQKTILNKNKQTIQEIEKEIGQIYLKKKFKNAEKVVKINFWQTIKNSIFRKK